jgi:GT2 family glycosyltransferase
VPGSTPVSIIVPARNAARTIEACLLSILREVPQQLREVIVVDNGSLDETADIVRRFPVRFERIAGGFVSGSRNVGARLARHPLIAFIDSDCVVCDGWYDAIAASLAVPGVGVTGARHVLPDSPTWVEYAWDRAHRRTPGKDREDAAYIPAGNMAVHRELFLEVSGFDEALETGEDPDLCARIAARGYRVVEAHAARCVHLGEPKSLRDVFRRERWHGRGVRLRYADGRVAPIAVSTVAFGLSMVTAIGGAAGVLVYGALLPGVAVLAPLVVPGVYAARYSHQPRPRHFAALWPIYLAYFAGRAAALPVVVRRGWQRTRGAGASAQRPEAHARAEVPTRSTRQPL